MAEGLVNGLYSAAWEAKSAGVVKTFVKPQAIESMKKIGIDISDHFSKTIEGMTNQSFDLVVTVCDDAKEACPFFPGAKRMLHAGFEDPSDAKGSAGEIQEAFDKTRDEIKAWLDENLAKYAT